MTRNKEEFDETISTECLSPLVSAVLKNDVPYVEQFLSGIDVNSDIMGESGLTILALAIASSSPALVKLCLEYGADANKSYRGLTMYEAALHKPKEIYSLFFPFIPVDAFSPDSVPCHAPCLDNQFKFLNEIRTNNEFAVAAALKNGADPRAFATDLPFPIFEPVANQSLPILKILLQSGIRSNVRGKKGLTPLHVAAKIGSVPSCRELLRYGAAFDVRSPEGSPLQVAEDEAVIGLLEGLTLLFHMARHGDLKFVEHTLKEMPDEKFFSCVNCVNRKGQTLMQMAFQSGHPKVAEAIMALRLSRE